jgi:D-glycero-D-manno-heptose 1,7-bisphosphate phosphatase
MAGTALFTELDGVLIAPGATTRTAIALLPGVGAALARLRQRHVPVVVVTDQPRIARGELDEATVAAWRERLTTLVRDAGGELAGWYHSPHDTPHAWRKPRPGMLLTAARELALDLPSSWLIGTRAEDAQAAGQAGCAGAVLVGGAALPVDDLGIVVASARDFADAPRVMIPRQGGCWHQT